MAGNRRNTISYNDAIAIAIVAAISAVAAAFSPASPTGSLVIDAALTATLAGFVTWTGASAPWWALMSASGITLIGAFPGAASWILVAAAAFAVSSWIGWDRANQAVLRSVVAGAVAQVALRLEWNEFFLSSAILAVVAMGLIGVSGFLRRRRYVRKRILWGSLAVAAIGVLAVSGLAAAAAQARAPASAGYTGLLDGLEAMQNGDVDAAADALRDASNDLGAAADSLNGPVTQLARLVPGLAQNRNTGVEVLTDAAEAADAAATTLQFVDLDQLTVDNGVVDILALAALEAPLGDLATTIEELSETLNSANSPWLLPAVQSRLETAIDRAGQVADQAEATAAAARIGPALLGANEPRTYLIAFVNNAEARGMGGLMGNWTEITIDNGRLEVTSTGRTADLQTESLATLQLEAPPEYLARYGPYGAELFGGVAQKFWSNVTMSPDMPSVGNAMVQMYETATGTEIDGVFIIDPAGIAGLMEITGPVEIPGIDQRIDANNVEQFLTIDQYEFAENEREDLLTAVTEATIANVLTSTLPPPQQMAPALAPAVLNGHISGWVVKPAEQELFELIGMDAALPFIGTAATDAIAVVTNNSSGNKIESFLERTIEYLPVVNQQTGEVNATMRISLTNTSPTTGYPEYVIGNIIDEPIGTNRMLLDVFTRLGVDAVTLDGDDFAPYTLPELGYSVLTAQLTIPPGETVVLGLELSGNIGRGGYALVYRPQPLPRPDTLIVDAKTSGGSTIFSYEGQLERRSVLTAQGIDAWR